jgi:transposase
MSEPERAPPRRIEVFTGAGRRRTWSADQKAAIVADSFVEGASVCDVARRHGLTPQQLFTWRRQAREESEACKEAVAPPLFVPACSATYVERPTRQALSSDTSSSRNGAVICPAFQRGHRPPALMKFAMRGADQSDAL